MARSVGRPRKDGTIRVVPAEYTRWERFEWPAALVETARRRVYHLFDRLRDSTPDKVLASAYLQGVMDCADAIATAQANEPEKMERDEVPNL